jgi:hypothetical protein
VGTITVGPFRTPQIVGATAAKASESAGEVQKLGHGIFTYALLQGLGGAASQPGHTTVRVKGLLQYVEDEVPELFRRYTGQPQSPVESFHGEDFPLASVGRAQSHG